MPHRSRSARRGSPGGGIDAARRISSQLPRDPSRGVHGARRAATSWRGGRCRSRRLPRKGRGHGSGFPRVFPALLEGEVCTLGGTRGTWSRCYEETMPGARRWEPRALSDREWRSAATRGDASTAEIAQRWGSPKSRFAATSRRCPQAPGPRSREGRRVLRRRSTDLAPSWPTGRLQRGGPGRQDDLADLGSAIDIRAGSAGPRPVPRKAFSGGYVPSTRRGEFELRTLLATCHRRTRGLAARRLARLAAFRAEFVSPRRTR